MDRIDVDRDGYVTEKELEEWVRHVGNRWAGLVAMGPASVCAGI